MGSDKQYDGYQSYEYLTADEDYVSVELADMFSGYDAHEIALSDDEEARLESLVADDVVISLHDHPFYFPEDVHEDLWTYVREGRVHTAYEFLAQTPLDAAFDMHLDGLSGIHSKHGWKWDDIVHDVSMRACDIAHSDYAMRCRDVDDIHRAHDEGKIAIVPALESAAMIENELDRIELLYGMGVRCMGITYNASNSLGTGQGDIYERDGGLTAFGVDAVHRMNAVGMAVSTSHSSPQTTLDVCDVTERPIFDTHALAQTGGMGQRGSSDEELRAIADTGGVIGILSSTHLPDIETYMEHFEYVVDLVGIDHVAFGPDVLYGDHTSLLEVLAEFHGVELPESTMQNPYVKGLENPTEAWNNIPRWLVQNGYSDEEISKVLGGNVLRVLDEVW
ncbi:dipeptidase [Salinirubrum litoreum]|uniref:Dipeptidase n=1 Tax=Salinirubrum litoreum TaxID=1126234 RepID=A0ABD5RGS4_9EURY|nr:membrane dipeptidase [Salinirubrum litoreum]